MGRRVGERTETTYEVSEASEGDTVRSLSLGHTRCFREQIRWIP